MFPKRVALHSSGGIHRVFSLLPLIAGCLVLIDIPVSLHLAKSFEHPDFRGIVSIAYLAWISVFILCLMSSL